MIRIDRESRQRLRFTPDGLPILGKGKHATPADGACFMEFASVLAGEVFSDHPRCTHPLLADLARGVNDVVDDRTRQQLVRLVPTVIGLHGGVDASAAVVATATAYALSVNPDAHGVRRAHARAVRRQHARGIRAVWTRVSEPAYRQGAGRHAVVSSVQAVASAGPQRLVAMLAETIAAVEDVVAAASARVRTHDAPRSPAPADAPS